ncbi:MAG: sigma-70 family RNA polymerase sigma factor [Planctomycetes bacterium]|nr:sigma-70 family RNA polymerase sigma factor [Planctomycetota bacterium]
MHKKFGRLVYAVPRRFGLQPEDCDDVYQATWLTAVTRAAPPSGEADDVFVRWLAAIAAWETRNLIRRRRLPVRDNDTLQAMEDGNASLPERLQEMAEQQRLLDEALAALPERDRDLVHDLFLCDVPLSYAEIAGRLGLAVGSVGPMRLRAIERLRAELERRGF